MATKTGELREMLITAIEEVRSGKIEPHQALAMAKLAAQVNESLKVELEAMELLRGLGLKGFEPRRIGSLPAGEEVSN